MPGISGEKGNPGKELWSNLEEPGEGPQAT